MTDDRRLNRAERRAHLRSLKTQNSEPPQLPVLPSSAIKLTRVPGDDHVLVGIERPGYVQLTQAQAIEFANSLLQLAGSPNTLRPY